MFAFTISLFILLILIFIFLDYKSKKSLSTYELRSETQYLFAGDSHVQYCVNDSIYSEALNISQNSESTLFTFYKLRSLLRNNTSIKKVYLGFGFHSLSAYYDDYTFGEFSESVSARYYFILPLFEKLKFLSSDIERSLMILKNACVFNFRPLFIKKRELPFMGKYVNGFRNTAAANKSMEKRLTQQFYLQGNLRSFSELNINYLDSIVVLCKKRDVKLQILNTPLHSYYKKRIPEKFRTKYQEVISQRNLSLIDFKDLILDDSCFIPDGDHVSEKGAVLTTFYLMEE
jgi:hypothetical protein